MFCLPLSRSPLTSDANTRPPTTNCLSRMGGRGQSCPPEIEEDFSVGRRQEISHCRESPGLGIYGK